MDTIKSHLVEILVASKIVKYLTKNRKFDKDLPQCVTFTKIILDSLRCYSRIHDYKFISVDDADYPECKQPDVIILP